MIRRPAYAGSCSWHAAALDAGVSRRMKVVHGEDGRVTTATPGSQQRVGCVENAGPCRGARLDMCWGLRLHAVFAAATLRVMWVPCYAAADSSPTGACTWWNRAWGDSAGPLLSVEAVGGSYRATRGRNYESVDVLWSIPAAR